MVNSNNELITLNNILIKKVPTLMGLKTSGVLLNKDWLSSMVSLDKPSDYISKSMSLSITTKVLHQQYLLT